MSDTLRYDGLVVLVTGAGAGLGRRYALDFAARGASVVVNDLGGSTSGDGNSSKPAEQVVNEIRSKGGKAVANYDSVEFGDKLVKTAIDTYGKIDIVINNAGILRDKSFVNMSDSDWDIIQKVHLRGAFSVTKAAWKYMKEQNFGRVIFTASPSGLYGNFGQANYSAAKLGLLGLCNTLSIEGQRYNILCNTIAPTASSRLTQSVLPPEMHEHLKPEYISPLVLYLCHSDTEETGGVYEIAGGWISKLRWQRSDGAVLRQKNGEMTPEMVRDHFSKITDFSSSTYPVDIRSDSAAHVASIMEDIEAKFQAENSTSEPTSNQVSVLKQHKIEPSTFEYTDKDVRFYALSVGAQPSGEDLKFVYEQSDDFCVLPTFGVIGASGKAFENLIDNPPEGLNLDISRLLHGEQYLELFKPMPTAAKLRNEAAFVDVLDKGSGCVVIYEIKTYMEDDSLLAYNQFVLFFKGSGNFGGKRASKEQIPLIDAPQRKPDKFVDEKIPGNLAALYRLNGDPNPIHIDPEFAAIGGFDRPILHGLCTYAIACRHVLRSFAGNDVRKFKAIKARFSKPVFMGQTLRTEMWREGNRIHLVCKVLENGNVCLEGAYVDLNDVVENDVVTDVIVRDDVTSSDRVFEEFRRKILANQQFAKTIDAEFLWKITRKDGSVATWTMDFRGGDPIYKGEPKTGLAKVACTLTVSENDLVDIAEGRIDATKAYLHKKLKIKGNLMLVQKLAGLFKKQSKL